MSELYVLTDSDVKMISDVASERAIKEYQKLQKKDEKKQKKDNDKVAKTKKLLKAYRRIKATLADGETFDKEEEIELRWKFIEDLMGNSVYENTKMERVIEDAETKRQENLYLVHRIETAVALFKEECQKSQSDEAERRFRELSMLYLEDREYTVKEIAQLEFISEKTVYYDLGIVYNIICMYLLGV